MGCINFYLKIQYLYLVQILVYLARAYQTSPQICFQIFLKNSCAIFTFAQSFPLPTLHQNLFKNTTLIENKYQLPKMIFYFSH